jgi:plasmid maintenance system killer protein
MELIFEDRTYDRLEVDPSFSNGFAAPVVASYRSRIQLLRAAHAERDLTAMRCLSFQQLPARSRRQHSIRLDSHYRLLIELQRQPNGQVARIVIVRIDEI